MASRIMHLAISELLLRKTVIRDANRFRLGCILPDAYNPNADYRLSKEVSHYKETVCDGARRAYRLSLFREAFGDKMTVDDLYLGYYLHLVMDIFYRRFVYETYHWDGSIRENVERLHRDYWLINSHVVERYHLQNDIVIPEDFEKEPIFRVYPFGMEQLMLDLEKDFAPMEPGEFFFFTPRMAEEYIEQTAEWCEQEIKAIREGLPLMDELQYTWKNT